MSAPTFEGFVHEHGPRLLRVATLLAQDDRLAEDLVQDTLLALLRRWPLAGVDDTGAYARRALLNRFLNHRRRRGRELLTDDVDTVVADVADVVADRDAWLRLLALLPDRQRAVLVLRYFEGMTTDEIAEQLGCAPATVRSSVHRALNRLREVTP